VGAEVDQETLALIADAEDDIRNGRMIPGDIVRGQPFPVFDNDQRFDISWTDDGATWTAHNCTISSGTTSDPVEPITFGRQPSRYVSQDRGETWTEATDEAFFMGEDTMVRFDYP